MEYTVSNYEKIKYVIRYPDSFESGKKYPVLFYIHGAGGRGDNIDVIRNHSFFRVTEKHTDFPFVCIAPQCYADSWFDIFEQLQSFVKAMIASDFCDASRVYLIGASMGGYTTWQLAMAHPELFAAIAPICGGGMYWNAGRLKTVPVWAFHGEIDHVVLLRESQIMVDKTNAFGGNARLTVYENTDHNAWEPTFNNPEVFNWLLSNKKDG
ncbi:MAG: prolyl oligopeptidase family serine peptidase [Clostridia bacterium]|nr:prolyl oligopeptidase family serine peptidase [Clostridia bacterium]